jgi:hypothetical protein
MSKGRPEDDHPARHRLSGWERVFFATRSAALAVHLAHPGW